MFISFLGVEILGKGACIVAFNPYCAEVIGEKMKCAGYWCLQLFVGELSSEPRIADRNSVTPTLSRSRYQLLWARGGLSPFLFGFAQS